MRKIFLIIMIVVLTTLSGCSSNKVEVTVNGETITKQQIDSIVNAQKLLRPNDAEKIHANVVEELINQILLKQEAERENLSVSTDELESRYEQASYNWDMNPDMQKTLAAQGFTKDNFKEILKKQMLIQALTQKISQVSDDDVTRYYKSHINDYTLYTVKQDITTSKQDALSALDKLSLLKSVTVQASQLPYSIQQMLHSGQNFSKPEIIELDNHTWYVLNILSVELPTLEQIKDQVAKTAQSEKQNRVVNALVQDLKNKATITSSR